MTDMNTIYLFAGIGALASGVGFMVYRICLGIAVVIRTKNEGKAMLIRAERGDAAPIEIHVHEPQQKGFLSRLLSLGSREQR